EHLRRRPTLVEEERREPRWRGAERERVRGGVAVEAKRAAQPFELLGAMGDEHPRTATAGDRSGPRHARSRAEHPPALREFVADLAAGGVVSRPHEQRGRSLSHRAEQRRSEVLDDDDRAPTRLAQRLRELAFAVRHPGAAPMGGFGDAGSERDRGLARQRTEHRVYDATIDVHEPPSARRDTTSGHGPRNATSPAAHEASSVVVVPGNSRTRTPAGRARACGGRARRAPTSHKAVPWGACARSSSSSGAYPAWRNRPTSSDSDSSGSVVRKPSGGRGASSKLTSASRDHAGSSTSCAPRSTSGSRTNGRSCHGVVPARTAVRASAPPNAGFGRSTHRGTAGPVERAAETAKPSDVHGTSVCTGCRRSQRRASPPSAHSVTASAPKRLAARTRASSAAPASPSPTAVTLAPRSDAMSRAQQRAIALPGWSPCGVRCRYTTMWAIRTI